MDIDYMENVVFMLRCASSNSLINVLISFNNFVNGLMNVEVYIETTLNKKNS